MKYLHVRNLEKYQPGYKDRDLIWVKIHHRMLIDPDTKLLSEVAFARFVKLIVMETYLKKPIPCTEKYLSTLGFDFGLQALEATLVELSQVVDSIDVTEKETCDVFLYPREEKRREENTVYFESFSSGEKETKNPTPVPPPPPQAFEELWGNYPNKAGKSKALKSFSTSVKTDGDLVAIREALSRYRKHLQVNTWKHPQNGATWFNGWKDWVNFEEVSPNANADTKPKPSKPHPYARPFNAKPVQDSGADRVVGFVDADCGSIVTDGQEG